MYENLDHKWRTIFRAYEGELRGIAELLDVATSNGSEILPSSSESLFRALELTRFDDVRVLIIGQDPYPTPGYANGLAFSVNPDIPYHSLPQGLKNIFLEYGADLSIPRPHTGDLTPWAQQGVLLLNRALTVRAHSPGSHRGIGWHYFTRAIVRHVAARHRPLVAVLWGNDAQELIPDLQEFGVPCISSAHPSPRSVERGFFGSRPFTQVNYELWHKFNERPVDWRLP